MGTLTQTWLLKDTGDDHFSHNILLVKTSGFVKGFRPFSTWGDINPTKIFYSCVTEKVKHRLKADLGGNPALHTAFYSVIDNAKCIKQSWEQAPENPGAPYHRCLPSLPSYRIWFFLAHSLSGPMTYAFLAAQMRRHTPLPIYPLAC